MELFRHWSSVAAAPPLGVKYNWRFAEKCKKTKHLDLLIVSVHSKEGHKYRLILMDCVISKSSSVSFKSAVN